MACLRLILRTAWVSQKRSLSERDCDRIARTLEERVGDHVLSPLLKTSLTAWEALARDLEEQPWRRVAAKWCSRKYPPALQLHFWRQFAPYNGGQGLQLRSRIRKLQLERRVPTTTEKRLVLYVSRTEGEWTTAGYDFEPAEPGDELSVRATVKSHEERHASRPS